jgi:hypothetical protein
MYSKRASVGLKHRRSEGRQRHSLHDRRLTINALPEQFFDTRISLASVCPETALMYAVIEDALLCLKENITGNSYAQRSSAQEAARWFFSDDQHSPYSFMSICVGLGLDPEHIRDKLGTLEEDIPGKKITNQKPLHRSQQGLGVPRGLAAPQSYRAHRKEPL